MGGITLEVFSQSVAYREILGQGLLEGREEGRLEGREEGELDLTLRQPRRRRGDLRPGQEARVRPSSGAPGGSGGSFARLQGRQ